MTRPRLETKKGPRLHGKGAAFSCLGRSKATHHSLTHSLARPHPPKSYNSTDAADCCAACMLAKDCSAFVLNHGDGICFLKKSVDPKQYTKVPSRSPPVAPNTTPAAA